jgi:hypothetical protein
LNYLTEPVALERISNHLATLPFPFSGSRDLIPDPSFIRAERVQRAARD